eukprot:CAMPEP_0177164300 /NCGR_PEP_ID=MMETSP0367-20130122/6871_1 /TAXON_ID=447022 ORGANISM="Scrippsiella hangoei-like, Strain SHHI-4" /NCGR_SAMPLE_ID=MMETSP0367 /ASSEMBLY_ACC=CAM_ASM_000362 /LENGTH=218 /DNA_ID=CAMNT_0018610181 /DNA_START=28 /DNA_END=684 /DNA_ORIENTATION=-
MGAAAAQMGVAAAVQCSGDIHEEKFCTAAAFEVDQLAHCQQPPRCDMVDECLPGRPSGLTDQECADVLLVQAVMRADMCDIERALGQGANVNTVAGLSINMGEAAPAAARDVTPLMRACSLGHKDIVAHLLQARADMWRHDRHGWTPLCHALGVGEFEIARLLLEAAKTGIERQKSIAQKNQKKVVEHCEEFAGTSLAQALRKELSPGGFLANDLRRV